LQILKGLGNELPYEYLCQLSVIAGVLWVNRKDIQDSFYKDQNQTSEYIKEKMLLMCDNWCVNNINIFIKDIMSSSCHSVVVVLDDNGETALDLALFQRILDGNKTLRLALVVNSYPVHHNNSIKLLLKLLEDPYFESLKNYMQQGRVVI